MNPYLYLILAGWLAAMGVVGYLVWDKMQRAALKREKDKQLAALNPPLPGHNHESLPGTTSQLEPALPPSKEKQPEKYAEYQRQQLVYQQWRQLKRNPIPAV